jgi:molybdenum cofactor guanylyltransferase
MISSRFSALSSARIPCAAVLEVAMLGDYPTHPPDKRRPLGAVLAGGRARRLGGAKATAPLAGRPLLAWPLEALAGVLDEVVVVAKAATALPPLEVEVWVEPDEPSHPRAGIVHALARADGRAVLVCAADLPFVTPELLCRLRDEPAEGTPAVVPRAGGRLQPLLARYEPAALPRLLDAPAGQALTASVEALAPRVVECDADAFVNVNTPEDLAGAAQRIARR